MENISRILTIFISSLVVVSFMHTPASAAEYTREQSKVDTSISDQTTRQYSQPTKVYISQIISADESTQKNPTSWFRSLYYYSITRLGYVDLPYTYVIDREGNLYNGRDGGDNVSPEIDGDLGGVVIGYLSNSTDLTVQSEDTLKTLITKVSYTYGIEAKNIEVVDIQMVKADGRSTKSSFKSLNNIFSQNIRTVLKDVKYSDKEHISYVAEIVELKYEKTMKAGEKLTVDVVVKNINKFPWFTQEDYIYVSTKDSKNSRFAINGVWDSFSKPVSIENKTILPDETVTLTFQLQALLLPGKYSEPFYILKAPNTKFANTDFKVEFEITKGDFKLVQVVNTPGGVLNVRECPSGGCKALTQLDEGQVVIMVEKTPAGWYRVRYAEKKEGWVYAPYIKEL